MAAYRTFAFSISSPLTPVTFSTHSCGNWAASNDATKIERELVAKMVTNFAAITVGNQVALNQLTVAGGGGKMLPRKTIASSANQNKARITTIYKAEEKTLTVSCRSRASRLDNVGSNRFVNVARSKKLDLLFSHKRLA